MLDGVFGSTNTYGPYKVVLVKSMWHNVLNIKMEETINQMSRTGWDFVQAMSSGAGQAILIFRRSGNDS